jgi:hypothetical protein
MARPPLLIIFLGAFEATLFWLQHLEQVAGWLRLIQQADTQKKKNFDLLLKLQFIAFLLVAITDA